MIYRKIIILLILMNIFSSAYTQKNNKLNLKLNFQSNSITNAKPRGRYLYPIFEFENQSPDTLTIYYPKLYGVNIDSINSNITLIYSVSKISNNYINYSFPYPSFICLFPYSKIRIYDEIDFSNYLGTLTNGQWKICAIFGYLEKEEIILKVLDYILRERIVENEKILVSNDFLINIVKKK